MRRAYSYVRFSSPEQAKGRSQSRQLEDCERYCREHGLDLAKEEEYTFLDAGLSGYKGEHLGDKGQLNRFIKLVEDGTIESGSTLLVESLDRLSRQDVWDALPIFMNLIRKGIRIVTFSDNKVYSEVGGAQDLVLSIFIMARANEESSMKAKRIRDAMRNKHDKARQHKTPMGHAIPLWLELVEKNGEKHFKVRDERAAVIHRVFQMAIDGYGRTATAKALNSEGVQSFKGRTWGTSSIDKLLHNKAVLGQYQPYSVQVSAEGKRKPSGSPIYDYYPRIIEDSTFFEAQAAIDTRRITSATKQTTNFNVWQGVAKCVHCGTAMHLVNKGKPPKGGTYLQCYKARKGLCSGKVVRLDQSEIVFQELLATIDSLALVQDSSGKMSKDLANMEGRLISLKGDLVKYEALFVESPTTTVNRLIVHAEQDIEELVKRIEELKVSLSAEQKISRVDFLNRLDIATYEGRHRANALLKRLKIEAYIGNGGYYITEKGTSVFVLAYKDGRVGYMAVQDEGEAWKYQGVVEGEGGIAALLSLMDKNSIFRGMQPLEKPTKVSIAAPRKFESVD